MGNSTQTLPIKAIPPLKSTKHCLHLGPIRPSWFLEKVAEAEQTGREEGLVVLLSHISQACVAMHTAPFCHLWLLSEDQWDSV